MPSPERCESNPTVRAISPAAAVSPAPVDASHPAAGAASLQPSSAAWGGISPSATLPPPIHSGPLKSTEMGVEVMRQIQRETVVSGEDEVTTVTTIETRTFPNGSSVTRTFVEETHNKKTNQTPATAAAAAVVVPEVVVVPAATAAVTDVAAAAAAAGGRAKPVVAFSARVERKSDTGGVASLKPSSAARKRSKSLGSEGWQVKEETDRFRAEVIAAHNIYRAKHGKVTDLIHNEDLSRMAQKWAFHLSRTRELKHSNDKYRGGPVGQNVACKNSTAEADFSGQQVVDQWYGESDKYDFRSPGAKPGVRTGNFTQIVWKETREIGVGKVKSLDGHEVYVVCNYFPAGNYVGHHRENVFPPT